MFTKFFNWIRFSKTEYMQFYMGQIVLSRVLNYLFKLNPISDEIYLLANKDNSNKKIVFSKDINPKLKLINDYNFIKMITSIPPHYKYFGDSIEFVLEFDKECEEFKYIEFYINQSIRLNQPIRNPKKQIMAHADINKIIYEKRLKYKFLDNVINW